MLPAAASTEFSTAIISCKPQNEINRGSHFTKRGNCRQAGIKQLAPPPVANEWEVETVESNPAFNRLGGFMTRSNLPRGHIYLIQLNTTHRTGRAEGKEGLRGLWVKTMSSVAVSWFCLFPPVSLDWTVWLSWDYVTCNARPTKKRQTGERVAFYPAGHADVCTNTGPTTLFSLLFVLETFFFSLQRSAPYSSVS